jgi:transposase
LSGRCGSAVSKAKLVITAVVVEGRRQAEVAAAYGVSKSWVSKLVARYQTDGQAAFTPRSRRPKTSPTAVPAATVDVIVRLRKQLSEQGLDAGPDTLGWHLMQHHGIRVSRATIHRILSRAGAVVPQPAKRPRSSYVRFQAAQPNECWQADFTHYRLTRPDGAPGADVEILTWLDDCSRYALSVTAHPPGDRPDRARHVPRNGCRPWDSGVHADRQRHGVHHPALRRQRRPQRHWKPNCAAWAWCKKTPARTIPPPAARSNASSRR